MGKKRSKTKGAGIQGRVCETAIERIDKSPGDYRRGEPAPTCNVVVARVRHICKLFITRRYVAITESLGLREVFHPAIIVRNSLSNDRRVPRVAINNRKRSSIFRLMLHRKRDFSLNVCFFFFCLHCKQKSLRRIDCKYRHRLFSYWIGDTWRVVE